MSETLSCIESCAGDTWWAAPALLVAGWVALALVDAVVPATTWWGRTLHVLAGNLRRSSARLPQASAGAPSTPSAP